MGISPDHRKIVRDLRLPAQSVLARQLRADDRHRFEHLGRIQRFANQPQFADLVPRKVEHIADQVVEMLCGDVHLLQTVPSRELGAFGFLQHLFAQPGDEAERGAQFVADHGKETAFQPVRLFRQPLARSGLAVEPGRVGEEPVAFVEEERALDRAAQLAAQRIVDRAVVRADIEKHESDFLALKTELAAHEGPPLFAPQAGRHQAGCGKARIALQVQPFTVVEVQDHARPLGRTLHPVVNGHQAASDPELLQVAGQDVHQILQMERDRHGLADRAQDRRLFVNSSRIWLCCCRTSSSRNTRARCQMFSTPAGRPG